MYKTRLILILILLINFNIFSQTESNEIASDTINSLSNTDDVVDLFSISLSDDDINTAFNNIEPKILWNYLNFTVNKNINLKYICPSMRAMTVCNSVSCMRTVCRRVPCRVTTLLYRT